jgi:serine/threonine protein kinase
MSGNSSRYVTKCGFVAEPGLVIENKYELIAPIGRGASCKVWSANNLYGDFKVAIKFLNADRKSFELGKQEFSLLTQIQHPNIVRIFDMDEIDNSSQAYITMEYLDGKTLGELIGKRERVAPVDAMNYLRQLVSVLQYLRCMLIKHKDIKPTNLMVSNNKAMLIDFNIALTDNFTYGTEAYKCPSVVHKMKWDNYADVWALALSFYELLTLREVFEITTSYEIQLDESCPKGFPEKTFQALKDIIHGSGQGCTADDYKKLFCIEEAVKVITEIPNDIAEKYSITSLNQKFLTLTLLNLPDPRKHKSKDAIVREALRNAGLPAGKDVMKKLRAVFSQLKTRGVLEYSGKGFKKAVLINEFLEDMKL